MFSPDLVDIVTLAKNHGYLTFLAIMVAVGGTAWKLSPIITSWFGKVDTILATVQKMESNHLNHIEQHTEATVKSLDKISDTLERIALRDCPLLRGNVPSFKDEQ